MNVKSKAEIKKMMEEVYRRSVQLRENPHYKDLGAWTKYQDAWHPDEKSWLNQRKKEWRQVSKNLDLIHDQNGKLPKRLRKYHKELFFYGTIFKETRTADPSPFGSSQLFYLMWYFPEPSEEIFREFCGAYPAKGGELKRARQLLLDYSYLGKGAYGLLGGREALFAKVLIPPLDCKQELIFQPNGEILRDLWPLGVFTKCVHSSKGLLASRKSENWPSPYIAGQYLWDQMDYAFEHYYEQISTIDKYGKNRFLFADLRRKMPSQISYLFDLLHMILDFDEREDAPRDNPAARALRERLLTRFESRGFSPRLMSIWNEVKAHYESGSKEPLWGLF
jgi:hypothetical protein